MSRWPANPVVHEIATCVWLSELSAASDRRITLGSVPEEELERLAAPGVDALWLMGVWQRSPAARAIARNEDSWRSANAAALPDWAPEDVPGSPFAIYRYEVDAAFGDGAELAALRERMKRHGLRLMLDFVPNHLAVDHAWLSEHPERLVQGDAGRLDREPWNYFRVEGTAGQPRVFAHGRDPNFAGWPDTVQIDFRDPGARRATTDMLLSVAERCDGVRCDMAMLLTRAVFDRTWGDLPGSGAEPDWHDEFWPAAIAEVKAGHPDFVLIAEVYWDMEWELQQQGFDFTYDKRLYDRLVDGEAASVRAHLVADIGFQSRLVRFIENHDEERAAAAFGLERSRAAASLCLTLPGMRLLHDGQAEGRRVRLPVQLARRPDEAPDPALRDFYRRLTAALAHPVFHEGDWRLLQPAGQPEDDGSGIVAACWVLGRECRVTAANLAPHPARCVLPLELGPAFASGLRLEDLLSDASELPDPDVYDGGLRFDLKGHGSRLFALRAA